MSSFTLNQNTPISSLFLSVDVGGSVTSSVGEDDPSADVVFCSVAASVCLVGAVIFDVVVCFGILSGS